MRCRWNYHSPILLGFLSTFDPTGRLLRATLPRPEDLRIRWVTHEGWPRLLSRQALEVAAIGFQRLAGMESVPAREWTQRAPIPQPRNFPSSISGKTRGAEHD
jgi:hypothetical protein